jgi:hypothetical protein
VPMLALKWADGKDSLVRSVSYTILWQTSTCMCLDTLKNLAVKSYRARALQEGSFVLLHPVPCTLIFE